MASAGPNYPASGTSATGIGSVAWSNPGSIVSANNQRASASVASLGESNWLLGTQFSFAIPSGATIDGIVVEIERLASSSSNCVDNALRIVKGGVISATDRASAAHWPATDGIETYGSSSDLWGETWTAADINASNFGVALSIKSLGGSRSGSVDFFRITVYYTEGGSGPALPVFIHHYRQQGFMRHRQPDLLLPPSVQSQSTVRPFNWSLSV